MEIDVQRACLIVRVGNIAFWSKYDWHVLCDRIGRRETLCIIGPDVLQDVDGVWLPATFDAVGWGERDLLWARERLSRLAAAVDRSKPRRLLYETLEFPGLAVWAARNE
jgi:hypothetical protein